MTTSGELTVPCNSFELPPNGSSSLIIVLVSLIFFNRALKLPARGLALDASDVEREEFNGLGLTCNTTSDRCLLVLVLLSPVVGVLVPLFSAVSKSAGVV